VLTKTKLYVNLLNQKMEDFMGNEVIKKGDTAGSAKIVGGAAAGGAAIGGVVAGPIGAAVGGAAGAISAAVAVILKETKK
jgi:hypothetical protein